LEETVRAGARALVLQWLILFRAIGTLKALAEQHTQQIEVEPATPALAAKELGPAGENRYVVPGVGFSWDGDV
jgi:hypothetical protein